MICRFRKKSHEGFTLIEVAAGLIILSIIVSTLLVTLNQYIDTATNAKLKMKAFKIVRENMEVLLASSKVTDFTNFGYDEDNPEIEWQTTVESFYEPVTSRMWIQGVCSANYMDTKGEEQTVELTHWLTDVSKKQMIEIAKQKKLGESSDKSDDSGETEEPSETYCGYPIEKLMAMTFDEIFKALWNCDEF